VARLLYCQISLRLVLEKVKPMPWVEVSLVCQEDDTGCGVACVAMVLDCSYSKAKDLLFGKDFTGWSYRTRTRDLVHALRSRGAKVSRHLKRSQGRWELLPPLCIVKVILEQCGSRDWHWVVFARGVRQWVVLDPARRTAWKRPPWPPRGYLQIPL
jgi:hypothetical protein